MKIKFMTITLVSFILLSSICFQDNAEAEPQRLFDRLAIGFLRYTYSQGPIAGLLFSPFIAPWKGFRFVEPDFFTADPSNIDIKFLNTTEIVIGMKNPDGTYVSMEKFDDRPEFIQAQDYEFSLELPDDVPDGVFTARFDPPWIHSDTDIDIKTTLRISTNIPESVVLPDNIVLRVNVTKFITYGNLIWNFPSWGPLASIGKFAQYSGQRLNDPPVFVDILVRTNRFHLAEMVPPPATEIKPDQLTTIPITIKNLGSHIDTFRFNVSVRDGTELLVSAPPTITLGPGEVGITSLSVASPLYFQDPGTAHSVIIQAYSVYDSEKTFNNTVTIITRGVYVSEMNVMYAGFGAILLLMIVGFYFYRRKKTYEKFCQKPDKPWTLPEEKKHLEQLKETNKEEHTNVLDMMKQEYQSALLWHKTYCQAMMEKEQGKKQNIFQRLITILASLFKRRAHPPKEKEKQPLKPPKKEKKKKEIKPEKTLEKSREEPEPLHLEEQPEEQEEPVIDYEKEREKQRRLKAILKAKRAQEKQRRKFKKPLY